MGQKFPWREDLYALAQPGGEMDPVPRDKTFRTPRNGDLKERFIVGIWEGFPQGGRRHRPPNRNFGRFRTSLYSAMIRASRQSVNSPEETIRTISPHAPNGDRSPATRTFVSRTMFNGDAFPGPP
jgi:hypothetical protein